MSRAQPILYFSSLEKQAFRIDNYVQSWIDELNATFRIFFIDAALSPSVVAKSKNLFRRRHYLSLNMIDDLAFAAFCFDGGPMCSSEVSNFIKSKNIKRIGVISRGDIKRDMEYAISMGMFDMVVISEWSKAHGFDKRVLDINPAQPICLLKDSFNIKINDKDVISGICAIVDPSYSVKSIVNAQLNILYHVFGDGYLHNVHDYNIKSFSNGYIVLPQESESATIIRFAASLSCQGLPVFVPKEKIDKFGFGVPYKNILDIKNMTININKYENNIKCFDSHEFAREILSIIHRS
jgi:hypothetical protein